MTETYTQVHFLQLVVTNVRKYIINDGAHLTRNAILSVQQNISESKHIPSILFVDMFN